MLSPKDPLKGAMLGAAGGYGGTAMLTGGLGAAGGAGLTAGSSALAPGLGASLGAGGSAMGGGVGLTAGAGSLAPSLGASLGAGGSTAAGLSAGQAALAAPSAFTGVGLAPAGMAGASGLGGIEQFMQQNPYTTQMGYDYLQNKLQGSPQMPMAQSQGLLRGNQIPTGNSQYELGVPRISLI
jgi:hypothetical protein